MERPYLSDNEVLVVSKPLAKALGTNASIVLRRVQHWLEFNEKYPERSKIEHRHDGRWWTRNGYSGWRDDLEIFTYSTVRRLFTRLVELGLLISSSAYNRHERDATQWWSIDYERYDDFIALWHHHECPKHRDGRNQSKQYRAFMRDWEAYRALHTLLTVSRVCREADPAQGEHDPAHGEQATLLTVNSHPAHGEHTYPRESTEKTTERTTEKPHPHPPPHRNGEGAKEAPSSEGKILTLSEPGSGGGEEKIGEVFEFFSENFKQAMGPMLAEKITDAVLEFGAPRVLEAMRITILANKSWNYTEGVFRKWRKDGLPDEDMANEDGKVGGPANKFLNSPYAKFYANDLAEDGEASGGADEHKRTDGAGEDRAPGDRSEPVAIRPADPGAAVRAEAVQSGGARPDGARRPDGAQAGELAGGGTEGGDEDRAGLAEPVTPGPENCDSEG